MKIGGSLARKARFDAPTSLVSSLWFSCGVAVSMGEAAKSLLFEGFQAGCHIVLRGRGGTLHSTLRTLHSTLHTLHSTTLYTSHTPHSTLYTLHSTRHTPHSTLSTPHSRPQPSAQPSSLITSGFFSHPFPCSHSVAPTSAQFSAPISRPQPSAQPSSLISSFSSRHPSATPWHPCRPQPSAQFSEHVCRQPSAQPSSLTTKLLLPTHFQPPSRPRNSPRPFPVRSRPRSHARSAPAASFNLTHFQQLRCTRAGRSRPRNSPHPFPVRSCPRSQARSSPAASSPYPFPATPGAPTLSAAVRAILPAHLPSAAVHAAKLAHHQRLLLPTHFQPLRCTHAVGSRSRSSPHQLPVRSRPHSQARSSPAASSPQPFPATLAPTPSAAVRAAKLADLQRLLFPLIAFPSFPILSLPFPSFPFLSLPFPSFPFLSFPFPSFPLHPRRPHTTVQTSSLPHAVKQLNENPSIEDAFGKKSCKDDLRFQTTQWSISSPFTKSTPCVPSVQGRKQATQDACELQKSQQLSLESKLRRILRRHKKLMKHSHGCVTSDGRCCRFFQRFCGLF